MATCLCLLLCCRSYYLSRSSSIFGHRLMCNTACLTVCLFGAVHYFRASSHSRRDFVNMSGRVPSLDYCGGTAVPAVLQLKIRNLSSRRRCARKVKWPGVYCSHSHTCVIFVRIFSFVSGNTSVPFIHIHVNRHN
jgi:hypothetical protein